MYTIIITVIIACVVPNQTPTLSSVTTIKLVPTPRGIRLNHGRNKSMDYQELLDQYIQKLPDAFYYSLFWAAVVGLISERLWHLLAISNTGVRTNGYTTQRQRYFWTFSLLVASLFALSLPGYYGFQYGFDVVFHELVKLFNGNPIAGGGAFAVLTVHLFMVLYVLCKFIGIYRHPVPYAKRVFPKGLFNSTKYYVETADIRSKSKRRPIVYMFTRYGAIPASANRGAYAA
jgi:hypothetical protein